MTEIGSKILVYLLLSLVINGLSYGLKSSFLPNFIDGNLITILLALMAINSTTNSVILTKLKDILKDNPKIDFTNSKREMRVSILEQLALTIVAIIGLILKKSDVLKQAIPHRDFYSDLLLVAVLCYSIHVLYDTANAVFVILDRENKNEGAS